MILILAVIAGLIATILRAMISKRRLQHVSLRLEWLVLVAVIPQILAFNLPVSARLIPDHYIPYITISSMLLLLVFTLRNISIHGFGIMTNGLASNLVAVISNGGWMPISPNTLLKLHPELPVETWKIGERLALSKDRILSQLDTHFSFLTDIFPAPNWSHYKFAFSVGDILISSGAILFLWSLSRGD